MSCGLRLASGVVVVLGAAAWGESDSSMYVSFGIVGFSVLTAIVAMVLDAALLGNALKPAMRRSPAPFDFETRESVVVQHVSRPVDASCGASAHTVRASPRCRGRSDLIVGMAQPSRSLRRAVPRKQRRRFCTSRLPDAADLVFVR
jgi:hypothetical protein